MRTRLVLSSVLLAATLLSVAAPSPARAASGLTIDTWFDGGGSGAVDPCAMALPACGRDDELAALVVAAADHWERILRDDHELDLRYWWVAGEAPSASVSEVDADGRPTKARIKVPADTDWWYDPTPSIDAEFDMAPKLYAHTHPAEQDEAFTGDPPGVLEVGYNGREIDPLGPDLLTVILHEMGHAVGLNGDSLAVTHACSDASPYYHLDPSLFGGAEVNVKAYEQVGQGGLDVVAGPKQVDCSHLALGGIQACNDDNACEAHQTLMWTGMLPDSRALPSVVDALVVALAGGWDTVDLPRKFSVGSGSWAAAGTWIGHRAPDAESDAYVLNDGPAAQVTVGGLAAARNVAVGGTSTLRLSGGTLDAVILYNRSFVRGHGTVDVNRLRNGAWLEADGGTLTLTGSDLDLDDDDPEPGQDPLAHVRAVDGDLVITEAPADSVRAQVVVGPGRNMTFAKGWEQSASGLAGNSIVLHNGSLHGSTVVNRLVLPDGDGHFTGDVRFNPGAAVELEDAGDKLVLDGSTRYFGGSFTGPGQIAQRGDALVEANTTIGPVGVYDWDGWGGAVTTVLSGRTLAIEAGAIEAADEPDGFDGSLNLPGGSVVVQTPGPWTFEGDAYLNLLGGDGASIGGSPVEHKGFIGVAGTGAVAATVSIHEGASVHTYSAASTVVLSGPGVSRLVGGSVTGDGRLAVAAGSGLAGWGTIDTRVAGQGAIRAEGGTLTVNGEVEELGLLGTAPGGDGGDLHVAHDPWSTLTGSLDLKGGQVSGGSVDNSGSTSGVGLLAVANFANSGVVSPGPSLGDLTGILRYEQDFGQAASGLLDVDIAGLAAGAGHDQLMIRGTARLAGTLSATVVAPYGPALGDAYTIMLYGERIGRFDKVTWAGLPKELTFSVDYRPTALRLVVIKA